MNVRAAWSDPSLSSGKSVIDCLTILVVRLARY